MSNGVIPYQEVERMAGAIAKSGLFGVKTPEQAIGIMLVAQAEGKHPATACQEYDIIQGRPALKSSAMLGRFQMAGGVVNWVKHEDTEVTAEFSHPQACPKPITISWTMDRAKKAGLVSKDNWIKYPRQMLRARVIAEGVRACYPASCNGFYAVEEVQDIESKPEPVVQTKPLNTIDGLKEKLKAVDAVVAEQIVEKKPEQVVEVRKSAEEEAAEVLEAAGFEPEEWDVSDIGTKKTQKPDVCLKDIPVGQKMGSGEFVFLSETFKANVGKTGKTTLKVQDDEGNVYWIDRWGKMSAVPSIEDIITIEGIKVGEYNGKRQYMCDKVIVKTPTFDE